MKKNSSNADRISDELWKKSELVSKKAIFLSNLSKIEEDKAESQKNG
jgi:DNA-binding Xre family transcriptional regulator